MTHYPKFFLNKAEYLLCGSRIQPKNSLKLKLLAYWAHSCWLTTFFPPVLVAYLRNWHNLTIILGMLEVESATCLPFTSSIFHSAYSDSTAMLLLPRLSSSVLCGEPIAWIVAKMLFSPTLIAYFSIMKVKVKVFPVLLSCGLSPSPVVEVLKDHLLHGLHVEPRRADRYWGEIKLCCWLCSLLEQNILSFIQSRIFVLCHAHVHKPQCILHSAYEKIPSEMKVAPRLHCLHCSHCLHCLYSSNCFTLLKQ